KVAAIVWGLNPLVALFAVGGGHNDVLMLLFSTLGIYLILRARQGLGGAVMIAAAAIKLTGALLVPFALASRPSRSEAGRARRRTLVGVAIATTAIATGSYLCFGGGLLNLPDTLQRVQSSGRLQSVPGILLTVLGQCERRWLAVRLDALLAVVFCVWLLSRVWRGRIDWLDGAGWATTALLVSAGALLPWYVCWLIPICALTRDRRLREAAVWMTGIGVTIGVAGLMPHGLSMLRP
ncbi:MAG: glycosyltransferase 87 family protein, partial [Solirubrobacteraceae bacterium]